MAKEIERKFLINPQALPHLDKGKDIIQGYIPTLGKNAIRVRISDHRAFLTLKSAVLGLSRSEYEYEIPLNDAKAMIAEFCNPGLVEKTRYGVKWGGHFWEIDVFKGENAGLVIAEVELADEQQVIELPPWVTEEVTGEARYYNQRLAEKPFKSW